ncbi:MAG: aminodeoxychorismate synthase component I [Thermodesulfobacteriota bacterium]
MESIKGVSPEEAFRAIRGRRNPFIVSGGPLKGRKGEGGGKGKRFSFVSAEPFSVLTSEAGGTFVDGAGKGGEMEKDFLSALSELLKRYRPDKKSLFHFPFNGGAVGYFSYDLKDFIEGRPGGTSRKPASAEATDGVPLAYLGFYDPVFVYDHSEAEGYLVSAETPGIAGLRERFEEFKEVLASPPSPPSPALAGPGEKGEKTLSSNFMKEEYIAAVKKAKEYISAGDIYQINLSQKLSVPFSGDPFELYLALSRHGAGRFASYMEFDGFQIVSNSPERLLKIADGLIETQPIKGTRPRGATPEEDRALVEELKNSPKERAEHVMVVDLERSDLGKVSVAGTVEVSEFEALETYPHLHHMVSTVTGRLRPGVGPAEALKAVFPGGSITGTPKIRAMEIIDEIEPAPRGIYTGAMGWMDTGGGMDLSMAIRTALCKDGTLHLSVGGGIVADSDPEAEYEETLLKAKDFLKVLGLLPETALAGHPATHKR